MPFSEHPQIAGYAIEAALGAGGMATVYRGRQLALDRPVAIKILRAYGREAEELHQRFAQEARLIAALDHPHIVAIYEVTRTADGDACYVMPLLTEDLEHRPKPMPQAEIRRVLKAVLDALGHAHQKGVVHRDVKPANVLFDARDTPLLADFGVAFDLQASQRLTSHGRAVGSSQTMSPEQARGEAVDGRSDLYSVGCLAFELLTGSPPYEGDDFLVVALAHQQGQIPRLPQHLAHWQNFIDHALAKEPDARYPDAAAMSAALAAIASAPSAPAPARRPITIWIGAAMALLLLLLTVWLLRTPDATPAATDPLAAAAQALRARHWYTGSADSADALLTPLFAQEPQAAAVELRDRLLDTSGQDLLARSEGDLAQSLPYWAAFVTATRAAQTPAVQAVRTTLERRWLPGLERARERRDRAEAGASFALMALLPEPSVEFASLREQVATIPAAGEAFRDGDGPELLLIPGGRLAGFDRPFAVTRHEIARSDYLRFVEASKRPSTRCRDGGQPRDWREPGFEQEGNEPVVCVSHADATAYATWLSRRSGHHYRLPTRAEWQALNGAARVDTCGNLRGENPACADRFRYTAPGGRFASAPGLPTDLTGNVREWSADCAYREQKLARRAVTRIGNLFTREDRPTEKLVCIGRLVLGSGWRDDALDRDPEVANPGGAAIDRGFRLVREIP
ncbi:MAG: SUMF1/EgtB/PvdO family nonheme iron enzyme [Xanthomonadales bacterium]|nr:Serine/threonine-protein kinase PknD [Xanthomonadales bacterium]MCC6594031.1 SUMF1/EgtB/PvdO family nonheme iron enzyme [Xanthomonadales bacterium]MCE7931663.1 hypothetical protein [Xanthomonadales bacterium PRO6]